MFINIENLKKKDLYRKSHNTCKHVFILLLDWKSWLTVKYICIPLFYILNKINNIYKCNKIQVLIVIFSAEFIIRTCYTIMD